MLRSLSLLVVALSLLSCDSAPKADNPELPAPAARAEPAAAKPQGDPLILKVCKAFNAEVAASESDEMILARSALRVTTEYGVSERELRPLALPAQMLAAIEDAGSPKLCEALRTRLQNAAPGRD